MLTAVFFLQPHHPQVHDRRPTVGFCSTGLNLADCDTDTLQEILQHLPLGCRLWSATVCSSWHKAAVAATSRIEMPILVGGRIPEGWTDAAAAELDAWLEQHGNNIKSLVLYQNSWQVFRQSGRLGPGQQYTQLPARQLRELVVHGGMLKLSHKVPGDPLLLQPAAATLTKLHLQDVRVFGPPGLPLSAVFIALRNLKHLSLFARQSVDNLDEPASFAGRLPTPAPDALASCSCLQCLTALTYLALGASVTIAGLDSVTCISVLTNLQHLELGGCRPR